MSSNSPIITFDNVWKKYSRGYMFHRSLREDIVNIFSLRANRSKLYGDEFWALREISFSIDPGAMVGIYGPNGAGKSTLLKLISHITEPTVGEIHIGGKVAPLIEIGAGFHLDLSGYENIFVNGAILGMRIAEIKRKMDSIVEFSEIRDFLQMPIKRYSSGMYLKLAFSIAIHSEADIFLIDEVIAVGDEAFQRKCIDKVYELKSSGRTILFVTHDRPLLERLADTILYLDAGRLSVCHRDLQ